MSSLERWLRLPPWERRVLSEATFLLPCLAVALRTVSLQTIRARIEHLPRKSAIADGPDGSLVAARRIRELTAVAARYGLVRGTCLSRSLTLLWLLHRYGYDAELRLGVRRGTGLECHAWVEYEGRPLNDSADVSRRYDPFPSL